MLDIVHERELQRFCINSIVRSRVHSYSMFRVRGGRGRILLMAHVQQLHTIATQQQMIMAAAGNEERLHASANLPSAASDAVLPADVEQ